MNTKDTGFNQKKTLCLKGRLVSLEEPLVMGILNVTPDSFYDGGRHTSKTQLLKRAEEIINQGATFIDIGGYSSRPGAIAISEEEEADRVIPAIKSIARTFPDTFISIDTFRASIARKAVEEGACLVNDISGGSLDERMFETVSTLNVPYVLMHMRGTPQSMTKLTDYDDIVLDLIDYFQKKVFQLRSLGQKDILLDVGFGFAKTREQNYELLRKLNYFKVLELPLLVGLSRKSMVYKTLDIPVDDALNGTTIVNTIALCKGAAILRVHDVKEAVEAVKLYGLTMRSNG